MSEPTDARTPSTRRRGRYTAVAALLVVALMAGFVAGLPWGVGGTEIVILVVVPAAVIAAVALLRRYGRS